MLKDGKRHGYVRMNDLFIQGDYEYVDGLRVSGNWKDDYIHGSNQDGDECIHPFEESDPIQVKKL